MRTFTRFIISFIVLSLIVSATFAEEKTEYEKKVDLVVENFVSGQQLSAEEIDILAKIIASKNYRFYEIGWVGKYLNEEKYSNDLDALIVRNNITDISVLFENYEKAVNRIEKLKLPIYENKIEKKKSSSIQTGITYTESGDAGSFLESAQDAVEADVIEGSLDGGFTITKNDGNNISIDAIDYEDMFEIYIGDPNNFVAEVTYSDFDTQLFLFNASGEIVGYNDDGAGVSWWLYSKIRFGDETTPSLSPGTYYIAVTGWDNDAYDDTWNWLPYSWTDEGPGGVLGNWNRGSHFTGFGGYTITLEGIAPAVVLPPPTIGQWTIREDTYFRKTFPTGPTYNASSNTYFVQPRFNGSVIYITPASNWNGTAKITVDASGTTRDYYLRVLPVNDRPVIFPILDQTINANQTSSVTLGGRDVDNDILVFTATSSDANLTTSISGRTLTFTPAADWSGTADVTVLVSDGFLTDAWIFTVTVNPSAATVQRRVAGVLLYGGTKTSLPNTMVRLDGANGSVYETELDETGMYEFESVTNGYYSLSLVREDNQDPITAADALITAKYSIDPVNNSLNGMQIAAADVDASGNVSGGDALTILNKIIGRIDNFSTGEWRWNENRIGVGATDLNLYTKTIKTGDVDISLLNNSVGKRNVMYKSGETIQVTKGEEIIVPVKVSSISDFAAFDMAIKYDSENLEFLGVKSALGIMSNVVDDEIKLAWLNTNLENSITLDEGSTLLELRFNAKGELSKGYRSDFVPTKGEFLSKDGSKQNPLITISGISESTPMNFDLAQNYPNPFNPSTQITYSLPITGQVELTIFNVVGQKVATLVNEAKEAGNHKVEWNAKNIPSGVYFYTLNVNGSQNYRTTKKMLLLK